MATKRAAARYVSFLASQMEAAIHDAMPGASLDNRAAEVESDDIVINEVVYVLDTAFLGVSFVLYSTLDTSDKSVPRGSEETRKVNSDAVRLCLRSSMPGEPERWSFVRKFLRTKNCLARVTSVLVKGVRNPHLIAWTSQAAAMKRPRRSQSTKSTATKTRKRRS